MLRHQLWKDGDFACVPAPLATFGACFTTALLWLAHSLKMNGILLLVIYNLRHFTGTGQSGSMIHWVYHIH